MPDYYVILTEAGKAKEANSKVTGVPVRFAELALGDGNGEAYLPTQDQEALRGEVWRGALNDVRRDEGNPAWVVAEAIVPAEAGPFWVREAGIFDQDGDLVAIARYPETYKPALDSGAAKDMAVRLVAQVSNEAVVQIKTDPTVVLATRAHVADRLAPLLGAVQLRSDGSVVALPNTLFDLSPLAAEGDFGDGPDDTGAPDEDVPDIRIDLAMGGGVYDLGDD